MHGPQGKRLLVPDGFTQPPSSYRFRAWLAMIGLLVFIALYISLACWFSYTAYRMIAGVFAGGNGAVAGFFAAIPSAFLAIFMWKALFFVRQGSNQHGIEINDGNQPELHRFLRELADEIGAPRPHRVFLAPNVNAAVFYDLSILNLIIPTKKNLIIGLGLVNSLNRSEFKAVLAHEFGHFAQRSMAVGRWVYVGEQIASHIISKRDLLDKSLDFLSTIDLRVAWIGWIMRLIVWSIRSLMETVFQLVVLAHRALAREMEFQADLVAVSVTGSDPLVHALHRLQTAEEDWDQSLEFATTQFANKRVVPNLYAVQSRIGEHMRRILDDPDYGTAPDLPPTDRPNHRVFSQQIAQPPRMWSTHPPNNEREENAKKTYIASAIDNTPAWSLFSQPEQLKESVTDYIFEDAPIDETYQKISVEDSLQLVDEMYAEASYDPKYRGAYLGRAITIASDSVDTLRSEPVPRDHLADSLIQLYPQDLHTAVGDLRQLNERLTLLEAVQDGHFDASEAKGESDTQDRINRRELPELIATTKGQRDEALAIIETHDRACRTLHHSAARYVAHGWQEYLDGITQLLHYAEHTEAELNDAYGHLANVTNIALAAGRPGQAKVNRVVESANDLQRILAAIDSDSDKVVLPPRVLKDLEVENWRAAIDKLELPPADVTNIGQWLEVVESWVEPVRRRLADLRKASLSELLRAEAAVGEMYSGNAEATAAPKVAIVPDAYRTRRRGTERERQKKYDWWTRFTRADGFGHAVMRFAVAACIVSAVVVGAAFVGGSDLVVYNGLSVPVVVSVNGKKLVVSPHRYRKTQLNARHGSIEARTKEDKRLIESFEITADKAFASYVYNVAGAAPMVEWTAVYGNVAAPLPINLGCPRWRTTSADFLFVQPPAQIKSSGSGGTRKVLSSDSDIPAGAIVDSIEDPSEKDRVVRTHALWDAPNATYLESWLNYATDLPDFDQIVRTRLDVHPCDVVALRAQQDASDIEERPVVFETHRKLAQQHPDDPDWQYIRARAQVSGKEQDLDFIAGAKKWPLHPWFNYAAGRSYMRLSDWERATDCFELCSREGGAAMFNRVAVSVARLRRQTSHNENADLSDLKRSPEIELMLRLENGTDLAGSPYRAYMRLKEGRLSEAYRVAGGKDADARILILLAASKDAEPEWTDQALAVPTEQIDDPALLLYCIALATREGKPTDKHFQALTKLYEGESTNVIEIARNLMSARPSDDIESTLEGLDLRERGMLLTAGIILFEDTTPPPWRPSSRQILFVAERPHL